MRLKQDLQIMRNSSKFTDQLITLDSPCRHSRALSKSLYNTIQFRKGFSQSKSAFFSTKKSVWLQSATSIRRQKSPSFKFSDARRFSSVQQDQRRNRIILKLNIQDQISNSKGVGFAKSKRIDHFKPKKFMEDFPSPASYYTNMMNYKMSTSRPLTRNISTAGGKRISLIKFSEIGYDIKLNNETKGVTIPKQKNPAKVFMHHGQKLSYQPEITINNPGVGAYNINPQQKGLISTKKFYIGNTLKKFNEFVSPNPGPGAYGKEGQMVVKRVQSANSKGTFQLSKRTYLVEKKAQDYSPAPNSYSLKRFLQG